MPKQKLFDEESEEEVEIKTENEYAKKYDKWREKEEMHKLEQKYGSKALSSDASGSSDSEDDSEEPPEVNEELEEQFLNTLALLKTKDPKIYDPNYKFFEEKVKEEDSKPIKKTLTFDDSDDDDDDDGGNIFTVEKKAEAPVPGPSKPKAGVKKDKADIPATLRALWSSPALPEGEAFLRDYILNKRYLEPEPEAPVAQELEQLRDDEGLEADERTVEEQGRFERAYNFRFEEPDEEYLKRFPRTMNYIRPKDERRARKRQEVRTRKEEEKKRKMDDIARLKALKLKEIQEKIAKLKEVTGNDELAFKDEDIEGDFEPSEHDRRMRALFDDQYYGEADDKKPEFPDLDEELEIENWDNFEPEAERAAEDEDGPHCEDDDFNMDADFEPAQRRSTLMEELKSTQGSRRRNRKKKSKLAELLLTSKPKFVPGSGASSEQPSYSQYMEQYYALECEDVVAGMPTRFKYREVEPNSYGLTVEEILLADDKELTQWVPLKKVVRQRPAEAERATAGSYRAKASDTSLKRKIMPSLFKDLPEEPEIVVPLEETLKKKKKRKKNKDKGNENGTTTIDNNEIESHDTNGLNAETQEIDGQEDVPKKKRKKNKDVENNVMEMTIQETMPKKKKKKHKSLENFNIESKVHENNTDVDFVASKKIKHKTSISSETSEVEENNKKKNKSKDFTVVTINNEAPSQSNMTELSKKKKENFKRKEFNAEVPNKKKILKKFGKKNKDSKFKQNDKFKNKQGKDAAPVNPLLNLTDERLKAYGLNPKKYRSFLKYKKF